MCRIDYHTDQPDPPETAGSDEILARNTCCEDPTPGLDDSGKHRYCECCEADLNRPITFARDRLTEDLPLRAGDRLECTIDADDWLVFAPQSQSAYWKRYAHRLGLYLAPLYVRHDIIVYQAIKRIDYRS